jgi:capsular exopolysaccharide synthesis family protein
LFLATAGEKPKILLITSSMPGEGKSTVAANLARTLALTGSRVLLVDGDLRKGRLHNMFQLQNETGLVDLLTGTCAAGHVIQTDTLQNLSFISRGKTSRNPGDLFLSSGINQIFAQWRRDYDHVIIDSSPLFAADDVSCLAPKVDGVLFVVRRNHSSARITQEALVMLANRQANVLGVIFNGANAASHSYYYYKNADYHTPANSA